MYSILAIDVGSCRTKGALFEVVEERYRFIARADTLTTLYWPIEDVSVGVRHVIGKIEQACGRAIMGSTAPILPRGQDGAGVDFFVTTTSVGGSLRLLVITSSASQASFSQLKTIADLSAAEVEVIVPAVSDAVPGVRQGEISKALSRFKPHAIFVVAQGDSAPLEEKLGQDIVEAISQTGCGEISVRFLGESGVADAFAQGLRDSVDFRALCFSNLSGNDGLLALQRELAELWAQTVVKRVPGFSLVTSWHNAPIEHSFFAFGNSVRFLSTYHKADVVAVDIGASSIGLFNIFEGSGRAKLSSKYGVGRNAIALLNGDSAGSDESGSVAYPSIKRWMPMELPPDEIGSAILNKWARPWVTPETDREMFFERALGVESVQRLRAELRGEQNFFKPLDNVGIVVGAGSLIANQSSFGRMALTVLDALEPAGVFQIVIDRDALFAQLGTTGRICPQAAAEVLVGDARLDLGTCLACTGEGRPGSKAVTVEMTRGDSTQKIEVSLGKIGALPLASDQTASVVVKPSGGLDFGWGKGKPGKLTVRGGALGLIIDARGRPLLTKDSKHAEETRRWLESLERQEAT